MNFRTIASGAHARQDGPRRQIVYAPSADAYATLWSALVGGTAAPKIDFDREAALFIVAGQRPTGGYKVAVRNIALDGDTLVVDAPVTPPPPDAMVTQALTSPYIVLAIKKVDVARVNWKNPEDTAAQPRDQ